MRRVFNNVKKWNWSMGLLVAICCFLGSFSNEYNDTVQDSIVLGSIFALVFSPVCAYVFK